MLNVNDYFQALMRSGKMHFECGGPGGITNQPPRTRDDKLDARMVVEYAQKTRHFAKRRALRTRPCRVQDAVEIEEENSE